MANNKKNEELQSRRDFFKNAAKGVLPVFGAIMLAGIPNLIKAEEVHMGCQYGCSVLPKVRHLPKVMSVFW